MKHALTFFSITLLTLLTGCTTQSKAQLRAQQAYVSGQQQALYQQQQWQQQQALGGRIQIQGEVRNSLLEWSDGLTLSQAIVAAEYVGARDPLAIVIFRQGQIISVKPKDLLRGHDYLLQPGDRIEIRR